MSTANSANKRPEWCAGNERTKKATKKATKVAKKAVKKAVKKAAKKVAKKPVKKAVKKAVKKKATKVAKKAAAKGVKATREAILAASAPVKQEPVKGPPKKRKMPAKERREFRSMLLGLKQRLVKQIATLRSDSLTRNERINPEEDGTVAFDRQFALNLVSSERESLFEIDDALQRIENRTYGVCEDCGELVREPRLRALPFVRMCIGCQSAKEKGKVRFTPMFG